MYRGLETGLAGLIIDLAIHIHKAYALIKLPSFPGPRLLQLHKGKSQGVISKFDQIMSLSALKDNSISLNFTGVLVSVV